jgi:hypothetical protein
MASIDERVLKDGSSYYRIRVRIKGLRFFSLTFDNRESAAEWIEKNEEEFVKNPNVYIEWKKGVYFKMKKNNLKKFQGMICPKFYYSKD